MILTAVENRTWSGMLVVVLCIAGFAAHAQNAIGIPAIVNYPNEIYNAGSQNWT